MPIGLIGSRGSRMPCVHVSKPTSPPFMIMTHHATITLLWYMFSPLSHAFTLHASHLYVSPSSLQITWLADPALVTSVYPNWMQYMPRVLQEVSLLDGVDASVRGNGRRFSKTSSYPPCHHYAFTSFYPYFPTISLSPLFMLIHSFSQSTLPPIYLTNHSHAPYHPCSYWFPLSYSIQKYFLFMTEQCS